MKNPRSAVRRRTLRQSLIAAASRVNRANRNSLPDPTIRSPNAATLPLVPALPDPAAVSAMPVHAAERRGLTVSGAAVGRPGEGVRLPISLIGTKETAP